MGANFNTQVLMSGIASLSDAAPAPINPFMDGTTPIDAAKARADHEHIQAALREAGVGIVKIDPPEGCQDGVYTANWGLERNGTVVLSRLPNARKAEEAYAKSVFEKLGKKVVTVPEDWHFSGQGDALPCGNLLFCGKGYRADEAAQDFAAKTLGFERIQLQTLPQVDAKGKPVTNAFSGWLDSFFYDIDLALCVLRAPTDTEKGLIGWCPEAFTKDSQQFLRNFDKADKIEVSIEEAEGAFACNLVSNGETVIMSGHAPRLRTQIEQKGLRVITPEVQELVKGGGFIRCTTLTINNQ
jgi:N-dimethylarginine dimethylaminohydrolase